MTRFRQALRRLRRDNPLLGLLALNLAAGIAVAALAVGGLLVFDIHGLRSLMMRDASPLPAVLMLSVGFIVTFGSVLMGTAIMSIAQRPSAPPPAGGHRAAAPEPLQIPVRSE
jgi:hypothetical protein